MPTKRQSPTTPILSSIFLPADVKTWSSIHATAWAQALSLPPEIQNHILDANINGDVLIELSDKDIEGVVEKEEERILVALALRCLKYGGMYDA